MYDCLNHIFRFEELGGFLPFSIRKGGGVAEQSKTSGEKGWCHGFESRWQLAIPTPSSVKTCCYIKGQSFSYYVYVVWEVKEHLSR